MGLGSKNAIKMKKKANRVEKVRPFKVPASVTKALEEMPCNYNAVHEIIKIKSTENGQLYTFKIVYFFRSQRNTVGVKLMQIERAQETATQ